MTRGLKWINDLKRKFVDRICVVDSHGCWVRINHDRTRGEKIFVYGFPEPDVMKYVIDIANKTSPTHVIPSEELDGVLAEAEEATSPEGVRRAEEKRLEQEAQEKEARRLMYEEHLKEMNAQYKLRLKAEYAKEEAWWLENSSRLMAFLGF
jgi:hypothetical protein